MSRAYSILLLFFTIYLLPHSALALGFETTLPIPFEIANHAAYFDNDYLFIFGGSTDTVTEKVLSSKWIDNVLSGWSETTHPLPKALFWHSVTFDKNNVFVLGGNEYPSQITISSRSVFTATISNGDVSSWNSLPELPSPSAYGAAILIDGILYYSGGANWQGGISSSSNSIYSISYRDGSTGSWKDAGNLPTKLLGHSIINTGNKIYLIGGYNTDTLFASNNIYEGTIDSDGRFIWSSPITNTFPDLDYKPYSFMNTVVGNIVIVAGGRGPTLHDKNTYSQIFFSVIQPDGSLGPWQRSIYDLPEPTCCAGMANNGSLVFITGGHNGTTAEYFDKVWYASVADLTASEIPTTTPTPTPEATPTPTQTPVPTATPTNTPTPTPNQRPIIVFVPGMGASWNYISILHNNEVPNEEWHIPKYIDTYEGLLNNLKSFGYLEGKDLWIYPYDWRDSVMTNGARLKTYIQQVVLKEQPEGAKVVLIGHSMGGLICRAAADSEIMTRIDKIFTLGTPHGGSAMAYPAWEGADFSDFTSDQAALLRSYLRVNSGFYASQVMAIHDLIPSLQDLLPNRNYLIDTSNKEVDWSTMAWKSNLFPSLNSYLPDQTGRLHTLSGTGKKTISGYIVAKYKMKPQKYGEWLDGKPLERIYSTEGDDAVLVNDSRIPTFDSSVISNTNHGEIVNKAESQRKLFAKMGIIESDQISDSSYNTFNKAVIVMLGSPAVMELRTPSGSIIDPENNLILLDDPESGLYKVDLITTGTGEYHLYFGRLNGGDEAWDEYKGVSKGAGEHMLLTFNVDMNDIDLGADPHGNMKNKISTLITRMQSMSKYKLMRSAMVAHLRNLVKLLDHVEKQKSVKVKLVLVRNVDQYLVGIIELFKKMETNKQLGEEVYKEVLHVLRLIRLDLDQYAKDLELSPN